MSIHWLIHFQLFESNSSLHPIPDDKCEYHAYTIRSNSLRERYLNKHKMMSNFHRIRFDCRNHFHRSIIAEVIQIVLNQGAIDASWDRIHSILAFEYLNRGNIMCVSTRNELWFLYIPMSITINPFGLFTLGYFIWYIHQLIQYNLCSHWKFSNQYLTINTTS